MPDEYDDVVNAALKSVPRPRSPTRIVHQPEGANWSLDRVGEIKSDYQTAFGRPLPLTVLGQGSIHRKWGYDHRGSADVSLDPSSVEGQRFAAMLRERNVPFVAFSEAVPGVSTGKHFHLGHPSSRTKQQFNVGSQRKSKPQPFDDYADVVDSALSTKDVQPDSSYDDVIAAATAVPQQRKRSPFEGATGGVRGVSSRTAIQVPDLNQILTEAKDSPQAQAGFERRQRIRKEIPARRFGPRGGAIAAMIERVSPRDIDAEVESKVQAEIDADVERSRLTAQFTPAEIQQTKNIADQLRRHGPGVKRGMDKAVQGVTSSLLYKLAGLTEIPTLGQGDNPAGDWLRRQALAGELSVEEVSNLPQPEREKVAEFLTGMIVALPEITAATALGGPVGGFAALSGSEALGRRLPAKEVAKETVKGGVLGGVFKGAGRTGNVAKELGTIGAGTAATELAFGATPEEALKSAGANLLFAGGAKFMHLRLGRVRATENQKGVPKGDIRVVDEAGAEHVIQKPNMRGQGNNLAIPVKEPAVEPSIRPAEVTPVEGAVRTTPSPSERTSRFGDLIDEIQPLRREVIPSTSSTQGGKQDVAIETATVPPKLTADTSVEGAGRVTTGEPPAPSIPERPATIEAQMEALQASRRDAVLVPPGTQRPSLPRGYATEQTPEGVFYFDPQRISRETIRQKVADGTTGELLGHVAERPALGEPTAVVTAKDAEGREVQSSAVPPERVQEQVVATQAQNPNAKIETGGPEKAVEVLAERLEPSTTAAKREKVTEDRAARGLEPLPKPEPKPDEVLLADAKKANEADPSKPIRLADEVLNKPRALSDTETVQLDLHQQKLKNEYNRVLKELAPATDPETIKRLGAEADVIERETAKIEEAWDKSGSEKGRGLRAQRIEINQDFSQLAMVARAKKHRGRDLTDKERTKITEQHERISELETKLTEATERATKAEAEKAVGRIKSDVARENRRAGRGLRRESLDAEAVQLKQLISQAWMKQRGGGEGIHSAMGLAKLDPEGVVTKLVGQLARNRIEAHVGLKAEALVDEVHGFLKDTGLSRRDVAEMISGYGKTFEMSKDAVDVRLRELKSIIASNLGKADIIEKGIRPLRRGLQRDKPTQEAREAMRELRDTLREHGMQVERSKGSPEEQQKSTLDSAKARTRNRIDDLSKWIADGKRTVANRTEMIPDAELKALQGERDRLQKVFEAINDPIADQKKIENAIQVANKSVADLEAKIQSGNITSKPRAGGLTSPELEAIRIEQRALRGIISDLRNAARPKPSDIEVEARKLLSSNKTMTARLEKQIADYERRLRDQDTSLTPKREKPTYSPEVELLKERVTKLKAQFEESILSGRQKFGRALMDTLGIWRAVETAYDLSFGLRQGKIGLARHPVFWGKQFVKQFEGLSNEKYRKARFEMQNDPGLIEARRFGLEMPTVDSASGKLAAKEEAFQTRFSTKIPGIRQSEQTYNLAGDTLRGLWAKHDIKMLKKAGKDPIKDADVFRHAMKSINDYTGRTQLSEVIPIKGVDAATPAINQLTYSIRFWASRLKVLSLPLRPEMYPQIPGTANVYKSLPRVQRVEAWRTLFSFYGLVGAQLAFVPSLLRAGGADVEVVLDDPDNPDFLKLRWGKRHYDVSAGMQSHLRMAARMLKRIYEAKTGAETKEHNAPVDVLGSYLRSKESPPAGRVHDIFLSKRTPEGYGTDFKGDPVYPFGEPGKGIWKRIETSKLIPKPMGLDDALEAYNEMGWEGVATTYPASVLGEGVGVYPPKDRSQAKRADMTEAIKARMRRGETVDIDKAIEEDVLTKSDKKSLQKNASISTAQERFGNAVPSTALDRYERMDARQREEVEDLMRRKAYTLLHSDAVTEKQREDFRKRIEALGIQPLNPRPSSSSFTKDAFRGAFRQGARP